MGDGSRDRPSAPRSVAVWLLATALVTGLLRLGAGEVLRLGDPLPFDRLLVGVAALIALACAAWLWLMTTLLVAGALRGVALLPVGCPAWLRRVVLGGCGVALAGGLATPAGAAEILPVPPESSPVLLSLGDQRATATLTGLPLPERAAIGSADASADRLAPAPRAVTVHPGDSLWRIAARQLGPEALDGEVARLADRLFRLNDSTIGDDPDLLQTGQRLRLPVTPARRGSSAPIDPLTPHAAPGLRPGT